MVKSTVTHDVRAGGIGVTLIAILVVTQSILIQMLYRLGFSYPIELNFWARVGMLGLFVVHLCSDAILWDRLDLASLWQDTKRVLPLALVVAPLLNCASIFYNFGLSFATLSDSMILSTTTPVYAMLLGKLFLQDDVLWTYLLSGWFLCLGGTCLVALKAPHETASTGVDHHRLKGAAWLVASSIIFAVFSVVLRYDTTKNAENDPQEEESVAAENPQEIGILANEIVLVLRRIGTAYFSNRMTNSTVGQVQVVVLSQYIYPETVITIATNTGNTTVLFHTIFAVSNGARS